MSSYIIDHTSYVIFIKHKGHMSVPLGTCRHTSNEYLAYPIVRPLTWLVLDDVLSNLKYVSSRSSKVAPSIAGVHFLLGDLVPFVSISQF